jgi:hypothetical protein
MNDSSPLSSLVTGYSRSPWNKGKIIGPTPPPRPRRVLSIWAKLHLELRVRDLALFNLAIDSKLRGCDRERPSLGDGYDVPRRRMPSPHRKRTRELHYDQAHGPEPDPTEIVRQKRFHEDPSLCRLLGRRLLSKSHWGLIFHPIPLAATGAAATHLDEEALRSDSLRRSAVYA